MSGTERQENVDSDEEEDDDSDTEDEPILESRSIPTNSTTNRIRLSPHSHTAASMAESGELRVWDISPQCRSFDHPGTVIPPAARKPQATLTMHGRTEGYALDWSPHAKESMGKIASGDNDGRIFVSTGREGGGWATSKEPLRGHSGSVEELQWSPNERHVLCSASADGTVKIWDARSSAKKAQLSVEVSSSDVNVASWCRSVDYLLATGADDGVWGVWDLRTFPSSAQGKTVSASASFAFHQEPITSVEFHPTEDSVVAVACADHTVTQWDMSVELDDDESRDTGGVADVPPQLMFVHHMAEVKELHWQRQAPSVVVATGGEGFKYVFRLRACPGMVLTGLTVCSRPSVRDVWCPFLLSLFLCFTSTFIFYIYIFFYVSSIHFLSSLPFFYFSPPPLPQPPSIRGAVRGRTGHV